MVNTYGWGSQHIHPHRCDNSTSLRGLAFQQLRAVRLALDRRTLAGWPGLLSIFSACGSIVHSDLDCRPRSDADRNQVYAAVGTKLSTWNKPLEQEDSELKWKETHAWKQDSALQLKNKPFSVLVHCLLNDWSKCKTNSAIYNSLMPSLLVLLVIVNIIAFLFFFFN